MNSKEENSEDFSLDLVQEFDLWTGEMEGPFGQEYVMEGGGV